MGPLENFYNALIREGYSLNFIGLETSEQVTEFIKLVLFLVFLLLNLTFSASLGLINSNPNEIAKSLLKLGYIVPNIKPGNETKLYFEKRVRRSNYLGGVFFSSLISICFMLSDFLGIQSFR